MSDPIFQLPDARRALVLSPHPDDETMGCGGTLALYAARGAEIHVAVISDGGKVYPEGTPEAVDIVSTRKREALDAARVLGVAHVHFLDFPDGELQLHKDNIAAKIEEIISRTTPDIVFVPSPLDSHEDHRAVSSAAIGCLDRMGNIKFAFYEVYGTIRFNALVDIAAVLEMKEKAMLNYPRSLYDTPQAFVEVIKGFNRFRSLYAGGKGFYEAFWIIDRPLSKTEIVDWLTYHDGQDALNTVQESNEDAIAKLSAEIAAKTDILAVTARDLSEANKKIDTIAKSIPWRLAMKFYRARDVLLPGGSLRRRVYENLIGLLKER
jgi:LmbE family N-acetylglucosaminyl deacetylase